MKTTIRPPAVPLVTIDPYFSVWSMADRLYDDHTRHWTGKRNGMVGLIRIDGSVWRFAGVVEPNSENYYTEPRTMEQTDFRLTPLSSVYTFEAAGVRLTATFTTPLLMDDLDLLSRPASYISLAVSSIDGKTHEVNMYFDVTGEWCVDSSDQKVVGQHMDDGELAIMQMSHEQQRYLNRSGDNLRIDWGHFYLVTAKSETVKTYINDAAIRKEFVKKGEITAKDGSGTAQTVREKSPVMACVIQCGDVGAEGCSNLIVLAYDDIYSVEYFGDKLQAYWKRNGMSASRMLSDAFAQYPAIKERCDAFDRKLLKDGTEAGGEKYAELLALAYRQAIVAHKLVADADGSLLFFSKECFSNGCMATVDVSYPSIPLFLLYNPELIRAMMRPIFKYAASDAWPHDFAPHDVGRYPLANGQVYYGTKLEGQMPIEECGNMLIMAAAVSMADHQADFAKSNWELLTKWATYLLENGLDPENQLCTDDFAGHLAHNANLSIKAIMGITGYAILCRMLGDTDGADRFMKEAREMAKQWEQLAAEQDHYKLAFNQERSWSQKYNLVWDVVFGTGIFNPEIAEKEVASYLQRQNRYGLPLDSRKAYTKSDWLVWSATLASREEDFAALIEPLWRSLHETRNRVPFTDWYDTETAAQVGFQHRSVVGGIYMKLLQKKWSGRFKKG